MKCQVLKLSGPSIIPKSPGSSIIRKQVEKNICVHGIRHQEICKEERRKLAKGESVKSSEPSIRRDVW
jgi:hypothetical protein